MHGLMPLSALRPGQLAEVRQIVGSPEHVRRLEELGVRAGERLEMVRSGSPCIVRIGASTLCLRNGEILAVMVAPRMSA
jgi:ferrous iron transport protein A